MYCFAETRVFKLVKIRKFYQATSHTHRNCHAELTCQRYNDLRQVGFLRASSLEAPGSDFYMTLTWNTLSTQTSSGQELFGHIKKEWQIEIMAVFFRPRTAIVIHSQSLWFNGLQSNPPLSLLMHAAWCVTSLWLLCYKAPNLVVAYWPGMHN